jgi:hypothetical protein
VRDLVIVALLGKKKNGKDEWSYYSFHKAGRSFKDWLDKYYAEKTAYVAEHPTTDSHPVPDVVLTEVSLDISQHLRAGRTVVIMDSGGMERTGQVCKHLKAKEDFSG